MKLLTKTILVVIIIAVIAIAYIVVLDYFFVKSSLQSNIEQQQLSLTQNKLSEIDRFLNERHSDIQVFAARIKVKDALEQSATQNVPTEDIFEIVQSFKSMINSYGTWESISLINTKEEVIISIDEEHLNEGFALNKIHRELFARAIKGETVSSDFIKSEENPEGEMIFMSPVYSKNDMTKIVGVVGSHIYWPSLVGIIREIEGSSVHLYNKDGIVIANNGDMSKTVHMPNEIWTSYADNEIFQHSKTNADKTEILESIHGEYNAVVSYAHENGYLDYYGNGWLLTISTPSSEAFSPARNSASIIVVSFLPIAILVVISIIYLSLRFIIRPIASMTKAVSDIAKGDLSKRVEIKSKDELGILADSFNQMTEKLEDSYKNLENKVKNRTKKLAEKVAFINKQNKRLKRTEKAMTNLMEDLNEEKEELNKEKTQDEALLENIGEGVIAIDANGKTIVYNDSAEKMLQWKINEAKNKPYFGFLKVFDQNGKPIPLNKRPVKIALMKRRRFKSSVTKPYYYTRKNGEVFPVAITASPVILNNKVLGAIMIFRDISKEEEIDKAKTEFVSLASHQLRTPLSAINWFSEMLLSGDAGKLNKKQEKYLKEVYKGNKRMVSLVNALLNVSRIELGTLAIEPEPTNLKELNKSVLEELKPQIIKKKLKISEDYQKNLSLVKVDPKLIRIVFQNLLSNAVKYTPEGSIKVAIKETKDKIKISVADTGYGIPKEQQDKIFTKLFRADNVREKISDGTGLGLYIVKAIIDQSKGKVWFKSAKNKGTTFFVELPIAGMEKKEGAKGIIGSIE